jgi:hypothetical protein
MGNQESESKVDDHCTVIISRGFNVIYVMLFVTVIKSIAV